MLKALGSPDIKNRIASDGLQSVGSKPDEFESFIRNEIETVKKLVAKAGIKPG